MRTLVVDDDAGLSRVSARRYSNTSSPPAKPKSSPGYGMANRPAHGYRLTT
ncbi:hypothetical protein [Saccharothrix carnea]|uniref:hypothetical protein n=1 Tax=Saccharothrix carnea TaxID=1280637 RepID=UPI0015E6CDAB|nr:hypothetical protein [Saccharothrix carnea]